MIAELIDSDTSDFMASYQASAGEGVGAIEAPRGILYHHFQIDDTGKIVRANRVIPTGQNHANINFDLQELVPDLAAQGLGEKEIST